MSWQMTFNNLVLPKTKKSHAYIHDWAIWSIGVNRSLTASKARNSHARAFEVPKMGGVICTYVLLIDVI